MFFSFLLTPEILAGHKHFIREIKNKIDLKDFKCFHMCIDRSIDIIIKVGKDFHFEGVSKRKPFFLWELSLGQVRIRELRLGPLITHRERERERAQLF